MSKVIKIVALVAVAAAIIVFAAPIAGALASAGAALGIGAGVASAALISSVVGIGISLGLSAISSVFIKAPKGVTQSLVDRLNSSIVPSAPRKIVFGRTAAGNDVRFFETWGNKKDQYAQVIALASHRVQAIKTFTIEDELSWQGYLTGKYAAGITVFRAITEGTAANAASLGSGSYWNTASKFTGCAYLAINWKLDSKIFTSGIPSRNVTVVEGCPLYDPRRDSTRGGSGSHRSNDQSTWAFYDGAVELGRNPALALLTYLIGYRINGKLAWGMGVPIERINLDNFKIYANVCEERVSRVNGTTVQRYTVDGVLSTSDTHETAISSISAAMGSCKLTDAGGRYTLVGGYDDTMGPKVAFTESDLVAVAGSASPYNWTPAPSVRDTFNIARGRFADPAQGYSLVDWGVIETDPLPDLVPRTMTIDLGFVSSAETCQRIAKQFLLREAKTPGVFSATFGPKAFAAEVGSLVTLSLPAQGWNNKLFRVIEQAENHDLLFTMTLREDSPDVYAWDREEKPLPASIRPPGYNPLDTISPANLMLTTNSFGGANGINISEVRVAWTPETSLRVRGIQIESRLVGNTAWTEEASLHDAVAGEFRFSSNAPGVSVEVRCRFRMDTGVYSPWVSGTINTASVTISYGDILATPTTLAGINPTEGNKLGGIETGATVGAPVGTAIGGRPVTDVLTQLDAIKTGGFADTVAPPVPAGLVLSSTLTDAGATLVATWSASVADDLVGYDISLQEETGGAFEFATTTTRYERPAVLRNQAYTAKVRAFDKAGNRSAWSAPVTYTTVRDTVAPAVATSLAADSSFETITLRWTNPNDADLVSVEVWWSATNSTTAATRIATQRVAPGTLSRFIHTDLTAGANNYYWIKTVDSSNNTSAFSAGSGLVQTTLVDISGVAPAVANQLTPTVSTLPSPTNYSGPKLVFNSTDGKLYRYVAGQWTAAVATADFDHLITENLIDSRGLDIQSPDGSIVFGSDGHISPIATIDIGTVDTGTNNVLLSTIASNALVPSLNFVGEFATAPTEAQLGTDWRQNAVYKNSTDMRSYVLTGEPLNWQVYLVDGQSFTVLIESSNGNIFRPGQSSSTLLKARLFKNGAEVTSSAPDSWFRWRRVSGIPRAAPLDDATFNTKYVTGYKQVMINIDDIYARATFFVDVVN